jgi:hypothetical protein
MTEGTPVFVTNEVLATKLDTLTDEVRELRRELVRRDVYEAQRSGDLARIAALEMRLVDQSGLRRQTGFAILGAALAIVVAIASSFFR